MIDKSLSLKLRLRKVVDEENLECLELLLGDIFDHLW